MINITPGLIGECKIKIVRDMLAYLIVIALAFYVLPLLIKNALLSAHVALARYGYTLESVCL